MNRSRWLAALSGSAALLASSSAASSTVVLARAPGTITNLAADGAHVVYTTNLNSAACPAPGIGDRQQVISLDARTRKSVVLTTIKGCNVQSGPGVGLATNRWLAVSGKHVFWINGISSGDHLTTFLRVATPGSKPAGGTSVDANQGGPVYGPLVAGSGFGYANLTSARGPHFGCSDGSGSTAGCAPLVVADELHSMDASGAEKTVLVNTALIPKTIQAVSAGSALLEDPNGALTVVHGFTSGDSSTPLVGPNVDEAAIDRLLVVGLSHAGPRPRLGFWSATTGEPTGACRAAVGASIPGVALAGRVAAFATPRGIYVVLAPTGTRTACGAVKLVNLPKKTRLAGFAFTATGGLIYATNTGTKTARGVVSRVSPSEIAAATRSSDSNR